MSTFRGLEMAKQAMFTQQSGLYTTGHNIANANTEGFTRQRVNFETSMPTPNAARNRPQIPGQLGTGVQAGSIQRVRSQFLDDQFRAENSKLGFYQTRSEALYRLENLLNEPSETGLSASMDQFWQSLEDLSVNPENSGARSVVLQRGQALADTFNYLSNSLTSMREDLQNQLKVTLKEANTMLQEIDKINQEVRKLETHGYIANDLYDRRDLLLDQLSEIVPIKLEYTQQQIGDGVVSVTLIDDAGNSVATLLDGVNDKINSFEETDIFTTVNNLQVVSQMKIGGESISLDQLTGTNGSLSGLLESFGYTTDGENVQGDYPTFLSKLDVMAYHYVNEFNEIHGENKFFDFTTELDSYHGAAGAITVVLENPKLINAGEASGSGKNARQLADLFYEPLEDLNNSSMKHFYESVIGDLGVISEHINRLSDNTTILKSQVDNQRKSVSSVSLDEELTNMLKFQHAYNAAARSLTATDELLDRVINSMGIVGR